MDYSKDGQAMENEKYALLKLHNPFKQALDEINRQYLINSTYDIANFLHQKVFFTPYYEYSLHHALKKGMHGEEWAREIAKGLCYGLIYMHKQNMAHRDIKPGNIMLKDANTPIIIDFGLCDTKHPYNGTSDYLAPE